MFQKRLNIFITSIGHPNFRGGGNTIIHNISNEFAECGHNVTALYLAPRELLSDTPAANYKILIRQSSRIPILNMLRAYNTLRKIRVTSAEPEVIISTHHEGFLLSFFKKPNVLFVAASYDPVLHYVGFRDLLKVKWLNPLEAGKFLQLASLFFDRLLKMKADIVQCLSFYSLNQCVRVYGLDRSRIIVVPPGVGINEFSSRPVPSQKQILFMGGSAEYKGLDILIRALPRVFEKYNNASLLVIGELKERMGMLNRLAQELGVSSKIHWLGLVPQTQVFQYYKKAYCVVAPSRVESFLIVVIEAFAAGVPVIATPVGVVPDIIKNNVNGFIVEHENPEELAEALLKLFHLPRHAIKEMGDNGRKIVKERFTWGKISELFLSEIQSNFQREPR